MTPIGVIHKDSAFVSLHLSALTRCTRLSARREDESRDKGRVLVPLCPLHVQRIGANDGPVLFHAKFRGV